MILITVLLLGLISTSLSIYFMNLVSGWQDIWVPVVLFIGFSLVYVIIFVIYLMLTILFTKNNGKFKRRYNNLIKRVCELVISVTKTRLHVRGREKLPKGKTCFFVQNHVSNFDPLIAIWGLRNFDISFIMKESISKVPFVGKGLENGCFLPIDRENNRQALKAFIKAINYVKEGKLSIGIYPEGTRSHDAELAEFKNGAFKVAEKAKCPIVIIAIANSEYIKKRWFFKFTDVYLDIAGVIEYEEYKDMTSKEISDRAHLIMNDSLESLRPLRYKSNKKTA